LHVQPRARRVLWFAVPLVAAVSYVGYLAFDRVPAQLSPNSPARVEPPTEPPSTVLPKSVEPSATANKESSGSNSAIPASTAPTLPSTTTTVTTPIELNPVPSVPVQSAKKRPPEQSEMPQKKKAESVVANVAEQKKAPTVRVKPTVEVSPVGATSAASAQTSSVCESLYAKLSLGSVELTAAERARLATCK
jgi:hypothetical protein